jgi:hypothetical protein
MIVSTLAYNFTYKITDANTIKATSNNIKIDSFNYATIINHDNKNFKCEKFVIENNNYTLITKQNLFGINKYIAIN